MQNLPFKKLVCAAALAGAVTAAGAAQVDLGPVTFGPPTLFSGAMVPAGIFQDVFEFSLPSNGGSGYSVKNQMIDIPGGGVEFNTLLTTFSLFSDPDGTPFTSDDAHLFTKSASGSGANSLGFTWGPTLGGHMYLVVSGVTNGTIGGIYQGGISISPVPEPEVWAMMLVGAGLVGFQLRRKSKQSASNRFV